MRNNLTVALIAAIALMWGTTTRAGGPDTLWTRIYGERLDSDYAYSVRQVPDDGFIIAGTTKAFTPGDEDVCLMRTDADGDTLWMKRYGGSGDDQGRSMEQTPDGGYIVCGWTESFGDAHGDLYLIRTDANGDTLWTRCYGGADTDYGFCVSLTSDSGYIISGYARSFGAGDADAYLVKTDASGDTVWTRRYGGSGYDESRAARQTNDGGYISAGATSSFGAGGYDIYLLKTDSNGDTIWTRTVGGEGADRAFSVEQTSDDAYIVAGYTGSFGAGLSDAYLVKIDSNGDTLWTRTYGGADFDLGYSVCEVSGGGFIIAGYTESFGTGDRDVFIIRTDADGDTLWTKTFGGAGIDEAHSVQQTSDTGYIIAGNRAHPTSTRADVYLIRIAPDCSGIIPYGVAGDMFPTLQIRPNPLRDCARLQYQLNRSSSVRVAVYDVAGREVRILLDEHLAAGLHTIIWDGKDRSGHPVSSGLYLLQLEIPGRTFSTKLVVLK